MLQADLLRRAKHSGLSDRQIAAPASGTGRRGGVQALRQRLGIHPVFKTVTPARRSSRPRRPYHHSSYELDPAAESEVARRPRSPRC